MKKYLGMLALSVLFSFQPVLSLEINCSTCMESDHEYTYQTHTITPEKFFDEAQEIHHDFHTSLIPASEKEIEIHNKDLQLAYKDFEQGKSTLLTISHQNKLYGFGFLYNEDGGKTIRLHIGGISSLVNEGAELKRLSNILDGKTSSGLLWILFNMITTKGPHDMAENLVILTPKESSLGNTLKNGFYFSPADYKSDEHDAYQQRIFWAWCGTGRTKPLWTGQRKFLAHKEPISSNIYSLF